MIATTNRSDRAPPQHLAARRRDTLAALDRVHDAINRLRREKTPVSVATVARRGRIQDVPLHQCGRENHCR